MGGVFFPVQNSQLGCRGWLPGQCYAVAKMVIVCFKKKQKKTQHKPQKWQEILFKL